MEISTTNDADETGDHHRMISTCFTNTDNQPDMWKTCGKCSHGISYSTHSTHVVIITGTKIRVKWSLILCAH